MKLADLRDNKISLLNDSRIQRKTPPFILCIDLNFLYMPVSTFSTPPFNPDLKTGEVHVWCAALD